MARVAIRVPNAVPFGTMIDPADSAARRLEQLESKVAHLELAVQQMSDALYAQQRELERVMDRNRQLLEELDGGAAATSATAQEKPPHY